ncbi:hypothetical protein CYMTET_17783, partial [Cymbomonas tetramitiformis]
CGLAGKGSSSVWYGEREGCDQRAYGREREAACSMAGRRISSVRYGVVRLKHCAAACGLAGGEVAEQACGMAGKGSAACVVKDHSEYAKFFRMERMGVPAQ